MARPKTDHSGSFEFRCRALARVNRKQAAKLPDGIERDCLYLMIKQLETATEIYDFLYDAQRRATVPDEKKVALNQRAAAELLLRVPRADVPLMKTS